MRKFTSGDSSIHRCYHSDDFYRYKGYATTYVERTDEFWDIISGTWSNGSSTIPQYGYMRNANTGELLTPSTINYADVGMFSRIKSTTPASGRASLVFRASGSNKYFYRRYNALTGGHSIDIIRNTTTIGYSVDPLLLDTGRTDEITITMIGSKIRMWVNNRVVAWGNAPSSTYELTDATYASGKFGLKNEYNFGAHYSNFALFEVSAAEKGNTWDNFQMVDYSVNGSTKSEAMRIPGKIGSHLQTGSPDSNTYNITGRLLKSLVDPYQFDDMMERLIANELPVFIHTPPLKVSGIITGYNPPKPKIGTVDAYHDFSFTLIEGWNYEV